MNRIAAPLMLAASLAFCPFSASAQKEQDAGTLLVVDAGGREHKLKNWRFVSGTRKLSWLAAPEAGEKNDKGDKNDTGGQGEKGPGCEKSQKVDNARGPEALEFTEGTGNPLKKRVLTYVL